MSLAELLTASLLFGGCALASLQLWLLIAVAGRADERLQSLREQVDGELVGLEAALAASARVALPASGCELSAERMAVIVADRPLAAGLRRRITALAEGALLAVELDAEGLAEPRRRLFSAVALGFCPLPGTSAQDPGEG